MTEKIPVYFINGFLEAGKTNFIQYTIDQDYFKISGRTLLILCEEGVEEYDEAILKRTNTVMETFDDQSAFTAEALGRLTEKYMPERVIIEFNGMWNLREVVFPSNWAREQQITIVDGSTFPAYFANMRSMFMDMARYSDLILFNRVNPADDLLTWKRAILTVNTRAEIVFEDEEGPLDVVGDEDLPFDVNAPVIEIADGDYAIWYVDAMQQEQRYEGKTVSFLAMVYRPRTFLGDKFVPGRFVMTCCAQDVSFLGYMCKYKGAKKLHTRNWVKVTAKVHYEDTKDYDGRGPVLYAEKIEPAAKPRQEVIDMNQPA